MTVVAHANTSWLRTPGRQVQCGGDAGDVSVPVHIWNFETISVKNVRISFGFGMHVYWDIAKLLQSIEHAEVCVMDSATQTHW